MTLKTQIEEYIAKNQKGVVIGAIAGLIVTLLNPSNDFSILLPLWIVALLSGIILVKLSNKSPNTILLIGGVIGLIYLLKNAQLLSFSAFNTPLAMASVPSDVGKSIGAGKVGFFSTLSIFATLLFRIPVIGPWIAGIGILLLLIFTGVPLLQLTSAVAKNFNSLILIFTVISLGFLILKFTKK